MVTTDEWQQVWGLGKNEDLRELDVRDFLFEALPFEKQQLPRFFLLRPRCLRLSLKTESWCTSAGRFVVGLDEFGRRLFLGFLVRYLKISEMCNKKTLFSTCFNSSRKEDQNTFGSQNCAYQAETLSWTSDEHACTCITYIHISPQSPNLSHSLVPACQSTWTSNLRWLKGEHQ